MNRDFLDGIDQYYKYLHDLASIKSVYTDESGMKAAISYCKEVFDQNLDGYEVCFDEENNLIAKPEKFDLEKDVVYLSAHVDTVDANENEWNDPYHPWKIFENEKEIVGRGVSDCKAGVAFQLYLSYLAKRSVSDFKNLVFTLTFKEEGPGKKTAVEIANQMGKDLPLSRASTYLIVLENNVRVQNPPMLGIYSAERSNFAIQVSGKVRELRAILQKLSRWNPVGIKPVEDFEGAFDETVEQVGGHVCSVPREENVLASVILDADDNDLILAGDSDNYSIIPTKILRKKSVGEIKHELSLSNRSFDSLESVLKQLEGVEYKELKDFAISQGFNEEEKFKKDKIFRITEECQEKSEIDVEYIYNIGGSDATQIYTALDLSLKGNFFPVVMGPGSRSQRNIEPKRLTHGKNETFDKDSGKKVCAYLFEVLVELGVVG